MVQLYASMAYAQYDNMRIDLLYTSKSMDMLHCVYVRILCILISFASNLTQAEFKTDIFLLIKAHAHCKV